jgi:hypothetical protein
MRVFPIQMLAIKNSQKRSEAFGLRQEQHRRPGWYERNRKNGPLANARPLDRLYAFGDLAPETDARFLGLSVTR